jgi:hypothetical protein
VFATVRFRNPRRRRIRAAHLEQNVAASNLSLTSEEVAELDTAA